MRRTVLPLFVPEPLPACADSAEGEIEKGEEGGAEQQAQHPTDVAQGGGDVVHVVLLLLHHEWAGNEEVQHQVGLWHHSGAGHVTWTIGHVVTGLLCQHFKQLAAQHLPGCHLCSRKLRVGWTC